MQNKRELESRPNHQFTVPVCHLISELTNPKHCLWDRQKTPCITDVRAFQQLIRETESGALKPESSEFERRTDTELIEELVVFRRLFTRHLEARGIISPKVIQLVQKLSPAENLVIRRDDTAKAGHFTCAIQASFPPKSRHPKIEVNLKSVAPEVASVKESIRRAGSTSLLSNAPKDMLEKAALHRAYAHELAHAIEVALQIQYLIVLSKTPEFDSRFDIPAAYLLLFYCARWPKLAENWIPQNITEVSRHKEQFAAGVEPLAFDFSLRMSGVSGANKIREAVYKDARKMYGEITRLRYLLQLQGHTSENEMEIIDDIRKMAADLGIPTARIESLFPYLDKIGAYLDPYSPAEFSAVTARALRFATGKAAEVDRLSQTLIVGLGNLLKQGNG